jgi:hypothetical protein
LVFWSARPPSSALIAVLAVPSAWVLVPLYFGSVAARYSWGDGALLELYTHYVHEGQWELGPYSRFGWYHPGPLLFRALWPLYARADQHVLALNGGALLLNLLAIAATLRLVHRNASPATATMVSLSMLLLAAQSGDILVSFWNPHVVVMPLLVLLAAAAAVTSGAASAWIPFVLSGSLLAQSHVAVVPLVAACGLFMLSYRRVWWRASSTTVGDGLGPAVWTTAALALLVWMWWPSVHEALTQRGGNLLALWRFFTDSHPGQSLALAVPMWMDRLSALLTPNAFPVGGMEARSLATLPEQARAAGVTLIGGGLLGWVWWHAYRSGDLFTSRMAEVVLMASLIALWSVTRITGNVEAHQVSWIAGVGALGLALVAGTLAEAYGLARRWAAPASRVATMVVVGTLMACMTIGVLRLHRPGNDPIAQQVADLSTQVRSGLSRADVAGVVVRVPPDRWPEVAGVIVHLRKSGVTVRVAPGPLDLLFGPPLRARLDERLPVLHVMALGNAPALEQGLAATLLATSGRTGVWLEWPSSERR